MRDAGVSFADLDAKAVLARKKTTTTFVELRATSHSVAESTPDEASLRLRRAPSLRLVGVLGPERTRRGDQPERRSTLVRRSATRSARPRAVGRRSLFRDASRARSRAHYASARHRARFLRGRAVAERTSLRRRGAGSTSHGRPLHALAAKRRDERRSDLGKRRLARLRTPRPRRRPQRRTASGLLEEADPAPGPAGALWTSESRDRAFGLEPSPLAAVRAALGARTLRFRIGTTKHAYAPQLKLGERQARRSFLGPVATGAID